MADCLVRNYRNRGPLEGWDALVKEGAYTKAATAYNSTDYAVMLEDTPTQAMRAVKVDVRMKTASDDTHLVTNVVVFLSLERKKNFLSDEYGPWTVKDAWESVQ